MTNGEWKKIEIEFEDPSISQERWLELMKFFIQGNEMSLNKLKQFLEQ